MSTASGVLMTTPPARLIPDLRASMDRALAALSDNTGTAVVGLVTERGVNAAVVARGANGWRVETWIGKTWGGPVEGGAFVVKAW